MFGVKGEDPELFDRFSFQVEEEIQELVADFGIGDVIADVVAETGDAMLFQGVEVDGSWHRNQSFAF